MYAPVDASVTLMTPRLGSATTRYTRASPSGSLASMNLETVTFLCVDIPLLVAVGLRFFELLDFDLAPNVPDPLLQWNTVAPVNALTANSANKLVRRFTASTTESIVYRD